MQEFEKYLKEHGSYGSLSEATIKDASKRAHVSTNEQLHATAFDDTLSGTTAISVLLKVRYWSSLILIRCRPAQATAVGASACFSTISSVAAPIGNKYMR